MYMLSGFIQQAISVLEHDFEIGIINFYNDPSRFPLIARQISGDLKNIGYVIETIRNVAICA